MKKKKLLFGVTSLLIMTGAAKTICSAAEYSLYIDINFVGNLIFSTYDLDFYIDDKKIDTIPHGEDYTHLISNIEEGYHTIKFCSVDSPDVSGEDIIEIKDDTTFRCTLFAHSDEVNIDDVKTENGIDEVTAQTADDTENNLLSVAEEIEETETEKTTELLPENKETAAEKSSEVPLESEDTENLAQQNSMMTQEDARKVIIVAMTNAQATDVFSDDGNTYDVSKFHSYTDRSGDYMTLYQDGTWTQNPDQSWHVDGIVLEIAGWGTYLKATADISYNGTEYVVSNVHSVIANLDYIDSDDPYKTNSEDMQPSENNPFLTVSPAMIQGDENSIDVNADTSMDNGPNDSDLIILSEEWQNWYNDQFSWWDGAPTALEDLVKDALNDEKSYEYIDVQTSYFISQEQCDQVNPILEEMGSSVRLEVGDILYVMTFSAKNTFNATIKNTAYGVAKYSTDTTYLIGIE